MLLSDGESIAQNQQTLQVNLLGEFSLCYGETAVPLETPSYQSLLAYLLLHAEQIHTRQQLAFQFWPDSSEAQARTNLRKAIFRLRQILPNAHNFLCADRQTVQWRVDGSCIVDVWEFKTAVSQASQTNIPAEQQRCLEQAINIYHGDFMSGCYKNWALTTREKLRHQYLNTLESLLMLHEKQRQYTKATYLARKLLREDPLHEAAYRRLMRLQSLDGNVAGALRTYHSCATHLQRELDVSPSRATQEAYERLLKIETPQMIPLPQRVPLVAREDVWEKLQTIWKQAVRQQSQVVLLTGEAGIGKTRMAEELLDWTRRQGITTLTAVCYAAEGELTYAPITNWLRSEQLQTVLDNCEDKWLIECARLHPELLAQRPELKPPGPLTEGWQRQHLFTALAHVILATRQPILLFIDDLQWCDQDTLDWLHFLLHFDKQARFLLLGTIRTEEVTPDHSLNTWRQFTQRDSSLTEIQLNRLDVLATTQLANHITGYSLTPEQVASLYTETEGNPLFVVEMARAGFQNSEIGNQSPISRPQIDNPQSPIANLPPKVHAVLQTRLSQLSPLAHKLTNLGAAIGRSFTFELLLQASGDEEEMVVYGLDELWQRRIVREHGIDAYDFTHDKLRQVAYASLSPARRRLLHGRIIAALETLYADNLDKVSGQLAIHYAATRQLSEAINYYQEAAKVSNRVFAHQETVQNLRRAIALLPKVTIPVQQQVEMYELLGDVLALTGEHEAARGVFETAVSHAPDSIWQSQLYRKIANSWQVGQERYKAFEIFQSAEDTLGELGETSNVARWQEWLWIQLDRLWILYLLTRDEEMARLAEQIHPVLDDYGLPIQSGFYFQRLMLLGFRDERYVLSQETVRYAQASLAAIEKSGLINQIAFAHFSLGMTYLWYGWHGNLDKAEYHMHIAQSEAEEISDMVLQARCLTYLTLIYRRKRKIDKVREFLPRAMDMSRKANMLEYIGQAQAHVAWLAWLESDLEKTQTEGRAALENFKLLPMVLPFWGLAIWPMLDVNVTQEDIATAVAYAKSLLDPMQSRMPDALNNLLQQAITAWEHHQPDASQTHLQQALQLAQTYNYL